MIEIMDTTLRDGEQTSGVSFIPKEKLHIAQMLITELNVDRIEIGSARVSGGELKSVNTVVKWARENGYIDRLEVLGFIDGGVSIKWIEKTGCRTVNLLCKGSYGHLAGQLGKTPEEHVMDISKIVELAGLKGIAVNVYLEDWSNGIKNSPEYLFFLLDKLASLPICRYMLPDTLGILNPLDTYHYCRTMIKRYPGLRFDFHAHNDYDLAVANVFAAIKAGVAGIHTTVNGLGERAGNAALGSVLAVIKDQLGESTNLRESKINIVSRLVETYSGIRISPNCPIVGQSVFTQCAGVHADGDIKNNLYCNDLLPERFGRIREYALGKTSGKANIRKNLQALSLEHFDDDTIHKLSKHITKLGDKKEIVTQEDLPYIIDDVLQQAPTTETKIKVINYSLSLTQGLHPIASVKIEIDGATHENVSEGNGQYDAFMNALKKIYSKLGRAFPDLTDYTVTIPPGGRTDAFVQTIITWNHNNIEFKTKGLDSDQTEAAIKATIKMLNKIEANN